MKYFGKNKIGAKKLKMSFALALILGAFFFGGIGTMAHAGVAFADAATPPPSGFGSPDSLPANSPVCGGGAAAVKMTINIGCRGEGNPIIDATFAILRLLSDGVGLLVVGSIVYAGIQYTISRGDPNKTKEAMTRIRNTLIALLVYIFAYAILNYVLPAGFFAS